MIEIKAVAKKNPQNLKVPVKYYAGKVNQGEVSLEHISRRMAKESHLSEKQIHKVLMDYNELIPVFIGQGKIVRIEEFGSYYLSINSSSSDKPEDVSVDNIKTLRIGFRPSKPAKDKVAKYELEIVVE